MKESIVRQVVIGRLRGIGSIAALSVFVALGLALSTAVSYGQNSEGATARFVRTDSPAFTFYYPIQWAALPLQFPVQVLQVGPAGPSPNPLPNLTITLPQPAPALEDSAKDLKAAVKLFNVDFKILYEKPSQLKNGKSAYEAAGEFMWSGEKRNVLMLATVKDGATILLHVTHNAEVGEDLRKILYSLEVEPDKQ
jgi:hypothetical protein